MNKVNFLFLAFFTSLFSCKTRNNPSEKFILNHDILTECNLSIQNAVVLDGVSPPVASRRYYYSSVAAYVSVQPFNPKYRSLKNSLNGLSELPYVDTGISICLDLAAMQAFTQTAIEMVYKEDSIRSFQQRKYDFYSKTLSEDVYRQSISWGDSVSKFIVRWAAQDTFAQIRGTDLYLTRSEPQFWQPTPREFVQALEPQWKKLRPSVLKSSDQMFDSLPVPTPYVISTGKPKNNNLEIINPRFVTLMKEVYDISKNRDSSKTHIARYWDDNPGATFHYGHATIKVLKVSPAGHWLSLFSTVARKKQYDLFQSAEGMVRVSSVIFDGFIAVWHAKYKYEYIRPVTVIQRHIDSSWHPLIETPPFPEYPSAHSVISSAAATVLTHLFGNYSFTDSTEAEFGLGVRSFNNFIEASDEACMSRMYGGIHFREGMENGKNLGRAVANYQIKNLRTRN
jgi:hypothetical protein